MVIRTADPRQHAVLRDGETMSRIQDRAAVVITALLAIIGIGVTATKRQEFEAYLRGELDDVARQAAADRPTAD